MSAPPRYGSPLALDRAIGDRIKAMVELEVDARSIDDLKERSRITSRRTTQLRRDLAIQRLLARLEHDAPSRWILKGGAALQLRLDPSRPSLDLDVADADEPLTRELQIRDIERAASQDLGDHFRFRVDRRGAYPEVDGSITIPVEASLGSKLFARFSVDIAPRGARTESVELDVPLPVELDLPAPVVRVRVIRVEQQLADKTCAIHEVRGDVRSTRWRDLADVAMIASQIGGIAAHDVATCIGAEETRRPGTLPSGLPNGFSLHPEQARTWPAMWGSGGREVPIGFDEALEVATRFLDPLLAGTAIGTWDPAQQSWR